MNSQHHALHLIVRGRVQGVWFRRSTQLEAEKLCINGWVRNLPDGAVEIHAEGDKDRLKVLLQWCWQGPPSAEVSSIEEKWMEPEGFDAFQVR
ncbi:MAG: acylphosphatase [Nitrospinae bacterium CG11_big_fil_rev_8_21_14_0_20_45_15]|nr:MAG: acylphosphatase [Nitrospinae bacterium CG11_big_fil_rev_8_21_14_0_20_45_15]